MSSKVIIPWEERPAGCKDVLWRSVANPIIPRDLLPTSNSIFNSAVVPFGDGFAGVFRCDDTNRRMRLHVGFSKDAINWNIKEEPLKFQCDDEEIGTWVYGYDPRVCFIEVQEKHLNLDIQFRYTYLSAYSCKAQALLQLPPNCWLFL